MKEDETPTGNHPLFFVGIFYPQKKILALVKTNNNMIFLHLCFLGVPLNKVLTLD